MNLSLISPPPVGRLFVGDVIVAALDDGATDKAVVLAVSRASGVAVVRCVGRLAERGSQVIGESAALRLLRREQA